MMAKKNYNYGHIEKGVLVYAPNKLIVEIVDEDGNERRVQVFNASEEQYREKGELPIIKTPCPDSKDQNGYYTPMYVEEDDQVIQKWEYNEYTLESEV